MDLDVKRTYVGRRLERAREDLATAEDDLTRGYVRVAVNRAYYAVFHSASAVPLWIDVERVRHSGVQAAFNQFFVRPGLIEAEFGRTFALARRMREEQDYDLDAHALSAEEAADLIRSAVYFVRRIADYLSNEGAVAKE